MILIEKNITELLYRHNCVIIPGFGAFVGNYAEAKIDERRGLIYPPSKDIIFNKNIVRNDGLLINKIQEDGNVSESEAKAEIDRFIEKTKSILNEKGRLELPQLGILFYDQEKNIQFEQDRFSNLLLSSFGLGSVKFYNYSEVTTAPQPEVKPSVSKPREPIFEKPKAKEIKPVVEKEETKEVVEPKEKVVSPAVERDDTPVLQFEKSQNIEEVYENQDSDESDKVVAISPDEKRKFPWGRVAAAAIVLPLAFYSYWIPFETNVFHTGYVTVQDFNPLNKVVEKSYKKRDHQMEKQVEEYKTFPVDEEIEKLPNTVHYYSLELDQNNFIPIRLDRGGDVKEAPIDNKVNASSAPIHLIAGCFGDKSNAEDMVAELKAAGIDAFIVDKNKGLHRVSAGGFNSRNKADQERSKVKSLGYKTWVLRK